MQVYSYSKADIRKNFLVYRCRLKESEVMKVVGVVLLLCTTLCNGAYIEYDDVYENYIDDNKDTKSLIGKCIKTGSKCNHSTVLSSVTKNQHDLCKMAYDLACSEAQEPIQCMSGQVTAKADGKCENLDSDVSKVRKSSNH